MRDVERRRAVARAYLRNNPEYAERGRQRSRAAADRKRMADPVQARKLEIYQALVDQQGGDFCALCLKTRGEMGKRFHIDHDWETDEVRGLLCAPCNHAVGQTRAHIEWLRRAIAYLERPTYSGIMYADVKKANEAYSVFTRKRRRQA